MARKNKFIRRLPLVGIFLLLIVGICFFLYPIISNWYSEQTAQAVIKHYDEQVQNMGDEAIEKIAKQAEEYNQALASNQNDKVSVFSYNEMLSVTEAIGYIDIPKIGVYSPIYHGLSDDVLQKGIGHMEGTSLPVGGKSTHCVLAGHTGLPGSKLFTDIDTLKIGDAFYIHVLDRVLKYRVDQVIVVLPNNSNPIKIVDGEDYVTMVTCTPYGINDHRLLVRGSRVAYKVPETKEFTQIKNEKEVSDLQEIGERSYTVEEDTKTELPARTILWYVATAVIAVVIVGILLILLFPSKKKKRKKQEPEQVSKNETDNTDNKSADLED